MARKLQLKECIEGTTLLNFWIIKTDSKGTIQKLSEGTFPQMKTAYAEHNYTENDGYYICSVESLIKIVERKSW